MVSVSAQMPIQNSMKVSTITKSASDSNSTVSNSQSFGAVMGQMKQMNAIQNIAGKLGNTDSSSEGSLQELLSILNTDSLSELVKLLKTDKGEESDENSLQMEELIHSLDFQLNQLHMEDMSIGEFANLLGLNENDLPKTFFDFIQKLDPEKIDPTSTNVTNVNEVSISQLLDLLNKQGEKFVSQLMNEMPNSQEQIASVLKAIQLIGEKQDLNFDMQSKLFALKENVQMLSKQLEPIVSQLEMSQSKTEVKAFIQQVHLQLNQLTTESTQKITSKSDTPTDGFKSSDTLMNSNSIVQQNEQKSATQVIQLSSRPSSEAFAKELQQMMNRSSFGQVGGTSKLLIKLYPEQLGTIRIELTQKDGVMAARILASTSLGKDLIDSSLHQLKHAFSQQNIQMDRLDVSQTINEPSKQERTPFQQQSSNQQFQENDESTSSEENEQSFHEFLVELEV